VSELRRVGLIGDYNPDVIAHRAIPVALQMAGAAAGCAIQETWLGTTDLARLDGDALAPFDGLWCVPASPYQSFEGALRGVRHAREHVTPFLGTCGGFQHAVIEYARDVLGHVDAGHTELDVNASVPLFARLACSMVEVDALIYFRAGSKIREIYGFESAKERYRCNFGMNPAFASWFWNGPMTISGVDEEGSPRAIELAGHPFFVGTAYQPERAALNGRSHPLIVEFVRAVNAGTRNRR